MAHCRKILLLTVLMLAGISLHAQPGSGPGGGSKPGAVPISGIEILLAIGGLVGARKFLSRKSGR